MSDFDVPVKTWIRSDIYRQLVQLAKDYDTSVAVLVAWAATNSIKARPAPKRKYVRMTPELFERLVELAKTDLTTAQIARELGVSHGTVDNHIQRARSRS